MFQLWNEWKRKGDSNKIDDQQLNSAADNGMSRTCSMTSDSSSSPPNWRLDWNHQRSLSFKEDYVSFPSLEPSTSEVTCSN